MRRAKRIVTHMLAQADVNVGGSRPWDIQVSSDDFYARVLRDKSLGLGESYMEGWWECSRLDQLFQHILGAGLDSWANLKLSVLVDAALERVLNRQTRRKSQTVAKQHYDLGNDMFLTWLDRYNQYSCGYFANTDDLEQAQRNKLELTCRKLDLHQGDTVLDIGCGWGGFSRYAAERYGCRVTGVSISQSQVEHARKACSREGLPVDVLCCDYRDLHQTFDKIVSIGMFEHVGHKNHRAYMRKAHDCLCDSGIFLLHTIGSNTSDLGCDPWIRRYIFPGGELPSLAQISKAAEGLFVIEDVHNLGPHYDRTLMAWNDRFQDAWPRLSQHYSETFKRMWEYYLLCCAGAFRARAIQLWQIVLTKPGRNQPACRVA
ncbi:cyclopropane fatty acyl phospholipid synthase [Fundidesulfovibrio butyratiphilus]